MSARLFVEAGFDALATTSGGLAWALGYPDGEAAPWADVVAATARIVRSANVPVTADIEAGYGGAPAEVGAHIAEIISGRRSRSEPRGRSRLTLALRSTDNMVARLEAARQAANREGVPIVLNARRDVFHLQHGADSERLPSRSSAVRRISWRAPTASIRLACTIRRPLLHWSKPLADPSISPAGLGCPMPRHWNASG